MNKFLIASVFLSTAFMTQSIPSSTRAQTARENVTPNLKKQLSQKELKLGNAIYLRIFKQEKQLQVWIESGSSFQLFKSYPICNFGSGGLGPKLAEGDGKAPEGFYFVKASQLNPYSSYHLSFNLGFPNQYDRDHKRTGSALMVHGNCVSVGCYAMTDEKIEEIYTLVNAAFEKGQSFFRVHVFPFKMTEQNMQQHKDSEWFGFWKNLKQGYDFFEENNHQPPNVSVKNHRYAFDAIKGN